MALLKKRSSRPVPRPARRPEPPKKSLGNNRYRGTKREWKAPRIPWTGVFSTFSWVLFVVCGVVLVSGLSVGLLYGYRYLTISPYFAVKSIEIEGNFRLSSREILDIVNLEEGSNSLQASIDSMERSLLDNSWVRSASVKRQLPDTFIIRITEKEPRFWVLRDGVPYYADVYGKPIAAVTPGKFVSFPTLEVERGAEDMQARLPVLMQGLAEASLPLDMASLSIVRLSPGRGVEIFAENSRLALSIGPEEWKANLDRLGLTLADLIRRGELSQVREIRAHGASVWVIKNGPVTQS